MGGKVRGEQAVYEETGNRNHSDECLWGTCRVQKGQEQRGIFCCRGRNQRGGDLRWRSRRKEVTG